MLHVTASVGVKRKVHGTYHNWALNSGAVLPSLRRGEEGYSSPKDY